VKSDSRSRQVGSTLDVLELLAGSGEPVGVTEVADRLGLSAAGAHRLLSTLKERRYAEQDPASSRYSIGLQAFGLAALSASRRDLRERSAPYVRDLNEITGETVHLAVHDAGWIVYLEKAESRHPVAPVSQIGARAPAHLVATGRAILAYLPEGELEDLDLDGYDPAETRERGWAINEESWREGVSGVAAPIRDWTGAVTASVGCCLPARRLTDPEGLAEHCVGAANGISAELGFVNPKVHA